jgi:hypothetical protein
LILETEKAGSLCKKKKKKKKKQQQEKVKNGTTIWDLLP